MPTAPQQFKSAAATASTALASGAHEARLVVAAGAREARRVVVRGAHEARRYVAVVTASRSHLGTELRRAYQSATYAVASGVSRAGAIYRAQAPARPHIAHAPARPHIFERRERAWRKTGWYRQLSLLPRVLVGALFIVFASMFALVVATKAAAFTPSVLATTAVTPPLSGGITLQQSPPPGDATSQANDYLIGVWASNASPPTSGSVQVFVRLSNKSEAVAGVSVNLVVTFPGYTKSYGSVNTDGYGLATFTITYGGTPAAHPVYITGSATVNGEQITQQSYFVPQ